MIKLANILKEDCWDGYKQVGMKTKNGKQVPNCVPINDSVNEAFTKGDFFGGKIKINGQPVPLEVELLGADQKKNAFIVKVISIDKKYYSKLPKDGILHIPAKIFRTPGGGWYKIKTPNAFEDLRKWLGKGGEGGVGGGGWDRYNSKGERVGKCGDAKEGEPYSACLSKEKAEKLGKKGRASFVNRKRSAQKKAGDAKKGGEQSKGQKPTYVKTGA